jgi:hypothetical protein
MKNGVATSWQCLNRHPRTPTYRLQTRRCRICGADRHQWGAAAPAMHTAADLRRRGWAVAVHNDYQQHGQDYTFWLFTKGILCAKGEGTSDDEAIAHAAAIADRLDLLVFDLHDQIGDILYWWQLTADTLRITRTAMVSKTPEKP